MRSESIDSVRFLLQRVAEGDQSAFSRLFDLYRPNIYTTALYMTGDELAAEEILQDTFLKVWLKREVLCEIDNFAGWLFTVARNITYNTIKKAQYERKQLLKLAEESITARFEHTDHLLQEKEFNRILNEAIERLPPKQQQTYRLIKQHEMRREEAARVLNVSPETVKWNLDQAMKSIRAFCMARLDELPRLLTILFFSKYF